MQRICRINKHGESDELEQLLADLGPTQREDVDRIRSLGATINSLLAELAPYDGLWQPYKGWWKGFTPAHGRRLKRLQCREVRPHGLDSYFPFFVFSFFFPFRLCASS